MRYNVNEKCATEDAVLSNIKYPENINSEQLRKVLSTLKLKQDKGMSRTQNDLLSCYCKWVHIETRKIRVTDVEEHDLNAGNSTDCSDK